MKRSLLHSASILAIMFLLQACTTTSSKPDPVPDTAGNSAGPEDPSGEQNIEIQDFIQARNFIAGYFSDQYGVETTASWIEDDITAEDPGSRSTYRYVSGPLSIVISAETSTPHPTVFTIEEASDITTGFYWEGTLGPDGRISESVTYPPAPILNEALARDAVLVYAAEAYSLPEFGQWTDEGCWPTPDSTTVRTFSSGTWTVEVEFEPAAPLVSSYHVTLENPTEGIRWEGQITLRGEVEEISFSQ